MVRLSLEPRVRVDADGVLATLATSVEGRTVDADSGKRLTHVLEVNVDDRGHGGVYSIVERLVRDSEVLGLSIDIACYERFEDDAHLRGFAERGCQVHFVGREGSKLVKQLAYYANLKKLMLEGSYDCVHIHSDVANKILVAAMAARAVGMECVIAHSHSSNAEEPHRRLKRAVHRACRNLLRGYDLRLAACSEPARRWMFPWAASEDVLIVPNGADLDRFRFDPERRNEVRKSLGLNDCFVVGHVGRFTSPKNHIFLIDVFAGVFRKNPQARLLLVGEGDLFVEARARTKQLGIDRGVVFYGATDAVEDLYQAMDVFVLPSLFEGFPIVAVEAQANGLPVLLSDRITNEVALTPGVRYISIDNGSAPWVEGILSELGTPRYKKAVDDVAARGFSEEDALAVYREMYLDGLQ